MLTGYGQGRLVPPQNEEERLNRLEKLVETILYKLEQIESMLRSTGDPELMLAAELVSAFSLPATKSLEAASIVMDILKRIRVLDQISKSIIEAMSTCEPLTISEITRRVRELRGTASRRIVRERLRRLMEKQVVAETGEKRRLYILRKCLENKHSK